MSPKRIDREGLGESRTGTRQASLYVYASLVVGEVG